MKSRLYRQGARADSVEATRTAILDAVDEVFLPAPGRPFSLDEVAERGGTTMQTILRHFGTKAGLIEAASVRGMARTQATRDDVVAGDLTAIAEYLGRHYEETAPMVLRMLAVEHQVPEVARIAQQGREMHRAWVERVFAPQLAGVPARERRRRVGALVAVTDLLTWKVLTADHGLRRGEYVRTVRELLEAIR